MPGITEPLGGGNRAPEEIEREIEDRREDLAANISALGDEVRGRLNVRQRARDVMARGKARARDAMARGREQTRYAVDRGTVMARAHPEVVGAVAGGLIALGLVALARRRERRRLLH